MRWLRLIVFATLALAAFLAVGIALLLNSDLTRFKGEVARIIGNQIDRDIVIDGNFQMHIDRRIFVIAEDVRLANVDWADGPNMVTIDRIEIVVDTWSAIRGPLLIERVEIDGARVALVTKDNGDNNWTFGDGDKAEEETDSNPIDLIMHDAQVRNLQLTYTNPDFAQPIRFVVDSFDQRESDDHLLNADLRGSINGKAVTVTGKLGPFESLLSATNLEYDLAGNLGTLTIASKGDIDSLTDPRRPHFELRIKGPNIDDLTMMLGLPDYGTGDVDLDAKISPGKEFIRADIAGNIGQFTIDASGQISELSSNADVDFKFDISGPHMDRVGHLFDFDRLPPEPFQFAGELSNAGNQYTINSLKFNVGGFQINAGVQFSELSAEADLNAKIAASGPDLSQVGHVFNVETLPADPFNVSVDVTRSGDNITFNHVLADTGQTVLNGNGTLSNLPKVDDAKLKLTIKGENFARFAKLFGQATAVPGPFFLTTQLESSARGVEIIDLNAEIAVGKLRISGKLGEYPDFHGTKVKLTLNGDNLDVVGDTWGIADFPAVPFEITGEEEWTLKGLRVHHTVAKVGAHQVTFDGLLGREPLVRDTDLRVSASGPRVADLEEIMSIEGLPEAAYTLSGRIRRVPKGWDLINVAATVANDRLKVDGLLGHLPDFFGTNLDFSADGPELRSLFGDAEELDIPRGPFQARGSIEYSEHQIVLERVKLAVAGATGRLDANIDLPLTEAKGSFDFEVKGPHLAALLPAIPDYEPPGAPFETNLQADFRANHLDIDNFSIRIGDSFVNLSGELHGEPDFSATGMLLDADLASLRDIGTITNVLLPDRPLKIVGELRGTKDAYEMKQVTGKLGLSDFTGDFSLDLTNKPKLAVTMRSELVNLLPFLSEETNEPDEVPAQNPSVRVIPDYEIPLAELASFDARLKIDVREIRLSQTQIRNLDVDILVNDGALIIENFKVGEIGEDEGGFNGSFRLIPSAGVAKVSADVSGNKLILGLLTVSDDPPELRPKYDLRLSASGTGATVRELASSLNGDVRLTGGYGRLQKSALNLWFGDFMSEVIQTINPFSKNTHYTPLSCVAVTLHADNGILRTDPSIVIQTDRLNVISTGQLDLNDESLNINFITQARKGIGISAGAWLNPYIRIAGTMGEPKLVMDAEGTIVAGGAAVVTAGLSTLIKTVWDRVFQAKDPCGRAIEDFDKRAAERRAESGVHRNTD
jgi:uncharacterized protein involved in outer membrane biogenesis